MEILKGYGRFLVLVAMNVALLTIIVIKILAVASMAGWEAVLNFLICLLLLALFACVFYITGSVTGEDFNE